MELIPQVLRLESTFKAFGLDAGKSAGSTVSIEFAVPAGMTRGELKRLTLEEKEKLDTVVLAMEYARGSLTGQDYQAHRDILKQTYDRLLKRGAPADGDRVGLAGTGSEPSKAVSMPVAG